MKAGLPGRAAMSADRLAQVRATSGLAALSKPMWLSEIWTKEKPVVAASAEPISLEAGTPPFSVQTRPEPAQAAHLSACLR